MFDTSLPCNLGFGRDTLDLRYGSLVYSSLSSLTNLDNLISMSHTTLCGHANGTALHDEVGTFLNVVLTTKERVDLLELDLLGFWDNPEHKSGKQEVDACEHVE